MHAVFVTFRSTIAGKDLVAPFTEYAEGLQRIPGLVMKTWIQDGETFGGFHVFASRADAEAYLGGPMVAGLTANPAFSGWNIQHFDVLGELSQMTGTPLAVAA